jgi:hypothetical protein
MPNTKTPSADRERPSTLISLVAGWVQQGLESFFATQRIIVDLAMRQNTSALKSIREGLAEPEGKDGPLHILTELAVEGTANYVEAQRILLELAQQENEIVMNGIKERVGGFAPAAAMTNMIRRGVETFVEMQQRKRSSSMWSRKRPTIARSTMAGAPAAQNWRSSDRKLPIRSLRHRRSCSIWPDSR